NRQLYDKRGCPDADARLCGNNPNPKVATFCAALWLTFTLPLTGGGLRGADGSVHAKTGTGNAIQSHRIPDSVFRIMRHKGGLGAAGSHPAVFPVALVEAVLTAFSDPGDLIYEPFCGSGTQIVAAERAERRCYAMELDSVYCDVAVRRWEMATGRQASLAVE
ncbi:MAG: hypothetical protein K0B16_07270, partial [Burkholderiaceae bacterium]|nr:hypothetical protein [Burkholderiaceae bacterium]